MLVSLETTLDTAMRILHAIPSFYPAYFYGGPIRSSYELCRNLALLGCNVRVLTTDASGLDGFSMSRRTRKFLLRKASESAIAIDIYAIVCPQSWCVYLVNRFAGRTLYTSPGYTTSPRSRRCFTAGWSRNLSSGRPVADCSVGKAHPAAP